MDCRAAFVRVGIVFTASDSAGNCSSFNSFRYSHIANRRFCSNPASAYCEEQGNRLEIRTAADGSECDEWAYFRGTCGFAGFTPQPTTEVVNGWRTYKNQRPGYSFQYPADAEVIIVDEPQRSLIVSGSGMGGNKKVTCPVAMLPDEDVLSSEREKTAMDGLKGLAKQAHIIEAPGWGHPYGWLLQPDPVSKAILTFVQRAVTGM